MFRRILQNQKPSLVHDAIDEVVKMIDRTEHMFSVSCGTLLEADEIIDLTKEDADINVGERIVRRLLFQHLMVNPEQDLPASFALLSIVHDVERIGDYAKSLIELQQSDVMRTPDSRYRVMCRELHGMIQPLFSLALKAVRDSDSNSARKLMERHLTVKQRTDEVLRQATEDNQADRDTVLYALAARYLRRVSGHLSNVASSVVNPLDQLAGGVAE